MNHSINILIVFLLLIGAHGFGQSNKPDAPVLYYVTVDPETGYDRIVWYPTPSVTIADYYRVVVTQYSGENQPFVVVEIQEDIPLTDTIYINRNTESNQKSIGYSVVAINDEQGGSSTLFRSEFDDPDSTIFLRSEFDSCMASVTLWWNDYNTWRGHIAEYNIYSRLGPGIYQNLQTVAEGINTLVLNNLAVEQAYQLFVEAVHQDGRRSTSNMVNVFTHMSDLPDFINADYATISPGNFIDLSFTLDGASDITRYNLTRANNPIGPFEVISSFTTTETHVTITDEVPFTSAVYFYRLELVNNCGQQAFSSNLASNILLNGSQSDLQLTLRWNNYQEWSGGVEQYRIIRTIGRENPVTDTLYSGITSTYTDDLETLVNYQDPSDNFVCYQVQATENRNMLGIQGESMSNRICFSVTPDIRIPNAFIPNDTEPVNQVFEPVFSFLPELYEMIIYNRLGLKIWEGSEAWDGRINGDYVPEGVYVYYIRVYNYGALVIELNGKVTVVYR